MFLPQRSARQPQQKRRPLESKEHSPRQVELYRAVPVQPALPSHAPAAPGTANASLAGILQRMPQARSPRDGGDQSVKRAVLGAVSEGMQPIADHVAQSIDEQRASGRPLPRAVEAEMGQAFGGVDFSGVRVHTGAPATALNNTLQAKAFTTGRDIFFRDGAFDPASKNGKGILAHELTHTIQQGATGAPGPTGAVQGGRVQRLAVDDNPYPDLAPTATLTMRKSAGGEGGVYFADDGNASVVVKLDAPDKAMGAQVANQITAMSTGLQTSDFRIFAPGSAGNTDIKGDILAHTTTDQRADLNNRPVQARLAQDGPNDATNPGTAVILMEKMPNVSLSEMAQNPAEHDNLIGALTNPGVLRGFAKLIVADAITGNGDRFLKDLAPETAVPDIPANITNIFLSPDFQNVLAMDNEVFKASRHDRKHKDAEKNWSGRMSSVRALLNPNVCADIAEVLICAILYTSGDILPPQDGTVPPNYHLTYIPPTGRLGPLHHKMIQQGVRARMVSVLSTELPVQTAAIVKTLRKEKKTVRNAYNQASDQATGGTGMFKRTPVAKSIDLNVVTSRTKFLDVARKERDGAKGATKGISEAFKHFKRNDKKRK